MNALDQDIQGVTTEVVRMLSLTRESTEFAKRALIEADAAAAQRCADNDKAIDKLMDDIEQRILTIIARRQPAATNLRFLGAAYRMLADIERAGDYAEHVARAGADLAKSPPLKKYTDMQRILETIGSMIEITIKALTSSDIEAAKQAHALDKETDNLYEQIQRELLTYMLEDPGTITTATKLLTVARYLERCGDHIENVNEHIIFWLTNERL